MHLIHESTIRNTDGLYEIRLIIVKEADNFKQYVYKLSSEYAVRNFERYYQMGRGFHGIALKILNKWKVR
jgi:hypothetical protein